MKVIGLNVPDKTVKWLEAEAKKRGMCFECAVNSLLYHAMQSFEEEEESDIDGC